MSASSAKRAYSICYVVSKLGVGGAEKNLLLLTQNLPKDRFSPVVLSLNGEGDYAEYLRQAGVPVYSLGFPHPKFLWRTARFFARCSFDLFHGFMFHGNLAARLLAAMFGKPAVSAIRVAEGEKRWHVWLDRWTSSLVDRYTVNSRALEEFVSRELGVPVQKITVIPNALSEEDCRMPEDREEARRKLGIQPAEGPSGAARLIAMVGRLHVQKDPETLVRAAKRIVAEEEGVHFLIAGIGPLKPNLERLIAELGLAGRFHLLGLAAARDVYAACDIFVLPSRWEGFPNSAIEAMAAGKPAVLSDFAGASEVIDYGVTGLVFPRGDDRGLAEAVLGLLRNDETCLKMGRDARESVISRYQVKGLVGKNIEVYENLGLKTQ